MPPDIRKSGGFHRLYTYAIYEMAGFYQMVLVIPGGEERTEEEYRRLYEGAGFRLTRIVLTKAEVSVIEGQKV